MATEAELMLYDTQRHADCRLEGQVDVHTDRERRTDSNKWGTVFGPAIGGIKMSFVDGDTISLVRRSLPLFCKRCLIVTFFCRIGNTYERPLWCFSSRALYKFEIEMTITADEPMNAKANRWLSKGRPSGLNDGRTDRQTYRQTQTD